MRYLQEVLKCSNIFLGIEKDMHIYRDVCTFGHLEPLSKQEMKAKAELKIAYQVVEGFCKHTYINSSLAKAGILIGSRH